MKGIPGITTIIIGNDREFFSPVDRFVPHHLLEEYYESDLDEADMDIMWEGDNKIVVMPRPLDPEYIADVSAMFGYRNFHILIPHETSSWLCSDILLDQAVLQILVDTIRLNPQIQVIPFGNTPQFHQLILKFRELELQFTTPETPADDALWTVSYLDTKIGSRELLSRASQMNPIIRIPEGFIVSDVATGLQIAKFFTQTGRGIVYKANQGGSGIGVNVYPPDKLINPVDIAAMHRQIQENPLYNGGDAFIIEEYIQPNFSRYGVFPSVDARVFGNGAIAIECIDAMVIQHTANEVGFYGCVAGKELFSGAETVMLRDFTLTVGQILKLFGYIGWFDIDYILSPDGSIAATEINLRSTSH